MSLSDKHTRTKNNNNAATTDIQTILFVFIVYVVCIIISFRLLILLHLSILSKKGSNRNIFLYDYIWHNIVRAKTTKNISNLERNSISIRIKVLKRNFYISNGALIYFSTTTNGLDWNKYLARTSGTIYHKYT